MFLGVPYLPFFMVAGGLLLLSMYTNFWFLLTIRWRSSSCGRWPSVTK